ncbi:MAG: triose-phosphate isomerase [Acidimicrobiales bacterium]
MTIRRPLVIGNWKMNLDFVGALHLVQQLGVLMKNRPVDHTDVVVAAPFVDLRSVRSIVDSERFAIGVGAQHVNAQDNGPHTGEVSTTMLKRLNVEWVLVGHSERREHYFMSDDVVAETLRSVVRAGQHAVLCVGEDLGVRERGEHEAFVGAQLDSALRALDEKFHHLVTVAYEPLWAIGTGVNATSAQVREMTAYLRKVLHALNFSAPQVLYGGSVNAENAATIVRDGDVDGFLVGGASLKAESFYAILQACDDCYAMKR